MLPTCGLLCSVLGDEKLIRQSDQRREVQAEEHAQMLGVGEGERMVTTMMAEAWIPEGKQRRQRAGFAPYGTEVASG